MSAFLQLTLALAIIILAAKAGGYIAVRLRQPAVLGELFVGLILGPTVVDLVHLPFVSEPELLHEEIFNLAALGVVFLMSMAGLEVELDEMLHSGRASLLSGTLGVIAPLLLGAMAVLPFGYTDQAAWFIGIILTATSVSISAQTLLELSVLRTREGLTLLGAAIVDDVLVLLLAATLKSSLLWRERCFLACMAPRGIVAVAVSSVFALSLEGAGYQRASEMVPVTFLVVFVTVLLYGLGAAPLARRLGLIHPNPQGILFVVAHSWARAVAEALQSEGCSVVLVDNDWENIRDGRMEGLKCHYGTATAQRTREEIDFGGIDRMLAVTASIEANSLACLRYTEDIGRQVEAHVRAAGELLQKMYGLASPDPEAAGRTYREHAERLRPYLPDTGLLVARSRSGGGDEGGVSRWYHYGLPQGALHADHRRAGGRGAGILYTGSMGSLGRDGSMDLNILIRSMLVDGPCFGFRTGAGIVADSEAEKEVMETADKARGMLLAIESYGRETTNA